MDGDPDLAILTSGVQKELASKLAEEGVSLLHLNPHRFEDVFSTIRLLGNVVGEPSKAEQLCVTMQTEVESIRRQAEALPWHPRVYFEEWMDPIICGTGWVSDLIEIAGGKDVFRDMSIRGRKAADRVIQPVEIVAAAPDIILASWCGKPFEREVLEGRTGARDIPAVGNNAVHELRGNVLQCGPMLVDSLREIHGIICAFVEGH